MHLMRCQNAFWQRIKCILASNAFLHSVAEHFPLENVMRCQNAFDAKMHFGNASNAFLHSQNAFCRFLTFCKQNVRVASNAFDAKMHLMRCQNAFWHQMHFCNATHQMHFCIKCIFAQLNIFLWKMYALQKCICNILCYKMYASNAFLQNKM